jgi:hypothetical protein
VLTVDGCNENASFYILCQSFHATNYLIANTFAAVFLFRLFSYLIKFLGLQEPVPFLDSLRLHAVCLLIM